MSTYEYEFELDDFLGRFHATLWIEFEACPGSPMIRYDGDGAGYPGEAPSVHPVSVEVTSLTGEGWHKTGRELEVSGWGKCLDILALDEICSRVDEDTWLTRELLEVVEDARIRY